MTTYPVAAISDAVVAFQKGITLQQGRAFRDMAISIGEADPTVPLNLLPTVFLGTIATPSGTTATLSSLVLTPYRFLRFTLNGVSADNTASVLNIAGLAITGSLSNVVFTWFGSVIVDLGNGVATATILENSGAGFTKAGLTGYSQSTTSVSFSITGAGSFDAGSIRVYGEK